MPGTLQQAIAAIKAGDKAAGRRLLAEVIRNDPRNEAAWLWMSAVLDSDEQRRTCLERVLAINPASATARQGLARLGPISQPPLAPPDTPSPGATPPAMPPPSLTGRAALPGWSLLIAFGATIAVCATIGIAAYLALTGALGVLRQLAWLISRRKENAI
jgi:hypothetical protein